MFAIIQLGSFQYKVSEGDIIDVQRLNEKDGKTMNLDKILLFADGSTVKIGQPYLKDVKVTAEVVRQHQAPKVISYKRKRRKDSMWKKGHRQKLTALVIKKINHTK